MHHPYTIVHKDSMIRKREEEATSGVAAAIGGADDDSKMERDRARAEPEERDRKPLSVEQPASALSNRFGAPARAAKAKPL